jgi:endonuclease/exonuclease/phosphatase family metal-dependent hydrolase
MKRLPFAASLAATVLCLAWATPLVGRVQGPPPLDLRVMTYNLRYAGQTPPNAWPSRRPIMKKLIAGVAPDVIGTQEGLYAQLKDIASDFPAYEWIGLGRDGGSRREFMAIFYKHARLEPMGFDTGEAGLSDSWVMAASRQPFSRASTISRKAGSLRSESKSGSVLS